MKDHYQSNILLLESELKIIKKKLSWLYAGRLFTFLGFITLLVLFLRYNYDYSCLVPSLILLLAFLRVVELDLRYSHREKFLANKWQICRDELKFLDHQYQDKETGDRFIHLNPFLAADVDLFGTGSLYQYLNRCSTWNGKARLAQDLCSPPKNSEIIVERQEAVKELSSKHEFMLSFRATGMPITESGEELDQLKRWLGMPAGKIALLRTLIILIPLVNTAWIILMIAGLFSFRSLAVPLSLSLLIIYLNHKKISRAHAGLGHTSKTFEKYTNLIRLIENEKFNAPYLVALKRQFFSHHLQAGKSLKILFRLLNRFDLRLNLLVSFILNALLIYDVQLFCRLDAWKEKHKNAVFLWFIAMAEIDSLISLAVFAANNHDCVSYPRVSMGEFTFRASAMGHPLLPPQVRVCNDLSFFGNPSVIIITGANMAGKSTFLRTLSVNLILAMNGAPVCAREMTFTPCDIMSAVKIQDSLANNESYFYAELLRLKEILNHAGKNPTLVILDEILRGTNTRDKHIGSMGLLEKMIRQGSVVVIATHDLAIGELHQKYPEVVTNYCFEVELTNDQLVFDYQLKPGISQRLNASFLMKKMNIID
ncbi:MAG: hypothetical protein NTU44_11875 [Bacteroidetes bacterium]|nr:hypothetical protein [Bacteroidota bacterium]